MFLVYKTINLVNGKVYIGVHDGDLQDSYLGSGTLIKRAIKKYGFSNFARETLFVTSSIEEAYAMEASLVDESFVKREDTYNLRTGGKGGFSHLGRDIRPGYKHTPEALKKISETSKGRRKSEESKRKASEATKGLPKSEEHKAKIAAGKLGKTNLGAIGRIYVTDGKINKRILKDAAVPEGWWVGRTNNWENS